MKPHGFDAQRAVAGTGVPKRMTSGIDVVVGNDANGSTVITCATCDLPIYERPLDAHACFQPHADETDA